jgi:hypothetical protein
MKKIFQESLQLSSTALLLVSCSKSPQIQKPIDYIEPI